MSFSKQVSAFVEKAKGEMDKEFRKNVILLWRDTVQGTPRITGVLRANWQIGINKTNPDKLPANSKNADVTNLAIHDTAIVFNNMEYADAVENGIQGTNRVPRRMLLNAINAAKSRKSAGR